MDFFRSSATDLLKATTKAHAHKGEEAATSESGCSDTCARELMQQLGLAFSALPVLCDDRTLSGAERECDKRMWSSGRLVTCLQPSQLCHPPPPNTLDMVCWAAGAGALLGP